MRKEQKLDKLEMLDENELQEWENYKKDLELAIENH